MELTIRKETAEDFKAVFNVHSRAFGRENEAMLVHNLRKSPAFIPDLSLVACNSRQIIGHILFTENKILQVDGKEITSLSLAPVAVLPEFQHKKIGSQLIIKGLEIAKPLDYTSAIVLGDENFYPKFGFIPAEKWHIKAPFEVPPKNFLAIELQKDALKNAAGTVVYPPEFSEV